MLSLELEDKLIKVKEVVLNKFLDFLHLEVHPPLVIINQIRAEQESLGIEQLHIINLILLNNQMPLFLNLLYVGFVSLTVRREETSDHWFPAQNERLTLTRLLFWLRQALLGYMQRWD